MCFKTYLITQFIKKTTQKKNNLRRSQFPKKRGGGSARYDHDHRFNGFFMMASLRAKVGVLCYKHEFRSYTRNIFSQFFHVSWLKYLFSVSETPYWDAPFSYLSLDLNKFYLLHPWKREEKNKSEQSNRSIFLSVLIVVWNINFVNSLF